MKILISDGICFLLKISSFCWRNTKNWQINFYFFPDFYSFFTETFWILAKKNPHIQPSGFCGFVFFLMQHFQQIIFFPASWNLHRIKLSPAFWNYYFLINRAHLCWKEHHIIRLQTKLITHVWEHAWRGYHAVWERFSAPKPTNWVLSHMSALLSAKAYDYFLYLGI